jgi:predicted HTH domain antitoxin
LLSTLQNAIAAKATLTAGIALFTYHRSCHYNTRAIARKRITIVVIKRIVNMSVVIPNELLTTTRMSEEEMKREIAVMLFEREKLTLAQASRFAGMNRIAFQHLLASRQIPMHYGVEDFEQDIKNLREMGRL